MMGPREAVERKRRLLIVDDSRLIIRVIRDFFGPHGYDVHDAENGMVGLGRLEEATPDVIVADVQMPVMDGWAFCEAVRRRPSTAEIPFVFLTIESELPKRLRGLHLGADDYVTKPFEVEELHARVERILERQDVLNRARTGTDAFLAGSVEHLAISDLLQLLSLNSKDGVVQLRQGPDEGYIVFDSGNIVHAASATVRGLKALFRMLGWATATFRVVPNRGDVVERTIDSSPANVLMDGLVSLDEWNRWRDLLPDREAKLEMSPDARGLLQGRQVSPAEFDVLTRAKGGATVGELLDQSPLPDADLGEAICTLLTHGIVAALD